MINSEKRLHLTHLIATPVNQELTAAASVRLLHFLSSLLKYMNLPLLVTETVEDVLVCCKE